MIYFYYILYYIYVYNTLYFAVQCLGPIRTCNIKIKQMQADTMISLIKYKILSGQVKGNRISL